MEGSYATATRRGARRGAAKAGAGGRVMVGRWAPRFQVTEGSAPGEEGEGGAGGEATHLPEGLYEDYSTKTTVHPSPAAAGSASPLGSPQPAHRIDSGSRQ